METGQTAGTMVAVLGTGAVREDGHAADLTREAFLVFPPVIGVHGVDIFPQGVFLQIVRDFG
jgi:hypothetical protein